MARPYRPTDLIIMRFLALTLFLAGPALAQTGSMDLGSQVLDLRYRPGGSEAPLVDFNQRVTSLGFYGDAAAFTFSYGTQDQVLAAGEVQSLSMTGVDMSLGGNVPVVRFGEGVEYSAYIPLRLQSYYRYLLGDTSVEDPGDDTSLHIAELDLGAGLGAAVEVPLGDSAPARRLRAFGTYVFGAGVQGDYPMGLPGGARDAVAYGLRTNTVMVQTEARELFGTTVGASLGYSFRTASTDTAAIESVDGLLNAFTGDDFQRLETAHLVHIGVIF